MKYLALLFGDETTGPEPETEEFGLLLKQYGEFHAKHSAEILGGEALFPTMSATTLQVRNGETTTTDGPFVEMKEALGGYYVLDCDNIDEAIQIASDIPAAKDGSIELRPIMELPE